MPQPDPNPASAPPRELNPWLLFAALQLLLSLACLIQIGKPSFWARVDIFSGAYLAMRALPVLRSLLTPFRDRVPAAARREHFGITSGPTFLAASLVLSILDLAVYLDYGHWRLMPALEWRPLQTLGLLLHLGMAVFNRWTSRYLRAAFAGNVVRPALMRSGPYAYVRHPTYVGAMIQKIAEPLVFGSVIAWVLALLWWALLLGQVRAEEPHLRELFGGEYEDYARQTAKLIPGVF